MELEPRLRRYESFLHGEYLQGFSKGAEYIADDINAGLLQRIKAGTFKTIIFTGMGCSAIVSDVIRAYIIESSLPIEVYVVNDYDFRFLVPNSVVNDDATLIVISSYSGHSTEPILALERLLPIRERVLLLTSGGRLAELGRQEGVSTLRWALSNPDREYPLFHVTQYFAILLNVFVEWNVLDPAHLNQLALLGPQIAADFGSSQIDLVRSIAADGTDANVCLIAPPKWHESLLKLCKMHLNEIAMVPATRNYLHEFCHSEVASLSKPERKHIVIIFSDSEADTHTQYKEKNLIRLLTRNVPANHNIAVHLLTMNQPGFLRKFFGALTVIQHATLAIGKITNTASRELISEAAANPWYHQSTIAAERSDSSKKSTELHNDPADLIECPRT